MISGDLVDVIRAHPDAARYQCVYERDDGPRRLGCAIAADGRDLVIFSLHVEQRGESEPVYYAVVETVPTTAVTALAGPDARLSTAVEALRDYADGLVESLVESRLRPWAEINANLGLAHHGFSVRIDMPPLARPVVALEGTKARRATAAYYS